MRAASFAAPIPYGTIVSTFDQCCYHYYTVGPAVQDIGVLMSASSRDNADVLTEGDAT